MKTSYVSYLVGGAVVTLLLGLTFKNWLFFGLSISHLTLLALGLSGIPPSDLDIETHRRWEKKDVYEGGEIEVVIDIENKGERLRYLEVKDELPSRVQLAEGSNHNILEMGSGETKTLRYTVSCPLRGKVEIGPIEIRYRDPLSLFSQRQIIEDEMELSVLPRIEDLKKTKLRPKDTRQWLGNIQSERMGIGTEFFSLREYHPGDEMRKINWKATAKYIHPITNEFEGEMSGDAIIIVDGFKGSNIGTVKDNILNASTRAAASLASSILADRNRVGLIVLGDFLYWVYPGFGREQFYKIMDNLSHLKKGGVWELKETKWLLKRFFPSNSLVIFISPLINPRVTDTLIDLCRKEYDVMVISPSPIELEKDIHEMDDHIAKKVHEMKRENILKELWKYAMVVDWDPTKPLEPALEEVVRYYHRK